MSKFRRAARVDRNQRDIVFMLRSVPGVTVELGHDDLLVGYQGKTYWIELKSKSAVSKRTGKILESGIKESQKRLRDEFTGHYAICSCFEDIIKEIGLEADSKR
jgi:hypothetical protein